MASYSVKRGSGRQSERKSVNPATGKNNTSKPASFSSATRGDSLEQRAYEIYMKRVSAGAPGDEVGDWLQAESELRSEEE
jgi:hypothetical protein